MGLTTKQEIFVQRLIEGNSQREAYKFAYDAENISCFVVSPKVKPPLYTLIMIIIKKDTYLLDAFSPFGTTIISLSYHLSFLGIDEAFTTLSISTQALTLVFFFPNLSPHLKKEMLD